MNEGVKHYWSFSVDRAVKSACIELQVQSQGKKFFGDFSLKSLFYSYMLSFYCAFAKLYLWLDSMCMSSHQSTWKETLPLFPYNIYIVNTKPSIIQLNITSALASGPHVSHFGCCKAHYWIFAINLPYCVSAFRMRTCGNELSFMFSWKLSC